MSRKKSCCLRKKSYFCSHPISVPIFYKNAKILSSANVSVAFESYFFEAKRPSAVALKDKRSGKNVEFRIWQSLDHWNRLEFTRQWWTRVCSVLESAAENSRVSFGHYCGNDILVLWMEITLTTITIENHVDKAHKADIVCFKNSPHCHDTHLPGRNQL